MPGPTLLDMDDPDAMARAETVLRAGGTVVLPTDTVYGLAALPDLPGATENLFALKGRESDHPLAVLVSDAEQGRGLLRDVSERVARWTERLWPGPLTIVGWRSATSAPFALGEGSDTIGVRCPDPPFVRSLAAAVGPIATTSANRTGEPTPTSARAAVGSLLGPADLVIDGGPAGTVASTVVDTTESQWRLLRLGAIGETELGG